ncbi:hypothetical protein [Streptomyces sp. NPDC052127]|uniref:hypothetical protein n=1 Tax=Streptomyces sp. NPDC052127 TaxID=3155679 RepID=UPI00343FC81A
MGEDPILSSAEALHSKLLLHGLRHQMTAEDGTITISMPALTALQLTRALEETWNP